MLVNHTHERLATLGLPGMAKAFDDQQRQPDTAALTFEVRLGLMIDREVNIPTRGPSLRYVFTCRWL